MKRSTPKPIKPSEKSQSISLWNNTIAFFKGEDKPLTIQPAKEIEIKEPEIEERNHLEEKLRETREIYKNYIEEINRHPNGYNVVEMSLLPNNNKYEAKKGHIYLSEEGKYVVQDRQGVVQEGRIAIPKMTTDQLSERLTNPEFISTIVQATAQMGHTKPDPAFRNWALNTWQVKRWEDMIRKMENKLAILDEMALLEGVHRLFDQDYSL